MFFFNKSVYCRWLSPLILFTVCLFLLIIFFITLLPFTALFLGLGEFDVAEGVMAVELADVHIAADTFHAAALGELPEGVAHRGAAAFVFGDEDVVLAVFLAAEVYLITMLAGVNHRLGAIFLLQELQQFVDTLHIKLAGMIPFDVEHRNQVEVLLLDGLADVGHLLVGRGLGAVDVIEAHQQPRLPGLGDIALIVGVDQRGALGGLDVDELDGAVGSHLGPIHSALKLGDIDASSVLLGL